MTDSARSRAAMPPDAAERRRALDPSQSFLVQAPAGSGKTHLLIQRFLRLLGEAEKPDEIVAITFTNAAAAEMRQRILEELEKADELQKAEQFDAGSRADRSADAPEPAKRPDNEEVEDSLSLPALARRALDRARRYEWRLLDQPGQLRIMTIDAFSRSLALQSPLSWGLLAGLGGKLDPANHPEELYRRAARRTLELLNTGEDEARLSLETLLLWRDNNWKDVEDLIMQMLQDRNRWFQDFVLSRDVDWAAQRKKLEGAFCRALQRRLERLSGHFDGLEGSREMALRLARLACEVPGDRSPHGLAERAELPEAFAPEDGVEHADSLEDALQAYKHLADFLLAKQGTWRKALDKRDGFPATPAGKQGKALFRELVVVLDQNAALRSDLHEISGPIPVRYTDEEWELVRHCFRVLRRAAGELQVVFAETGSVDFTEVSQMALRILSPVGGFPPEFALRLADGIHHLLVDEFQDTSRNQHRLLGRLIAAWPEREGRSCFFVGDPMQSIYGFRDAEVELFERVKTHGLEIGDATGDSGAMADDPLRLEFVALSANFRTDPQLVEDLNGRFGRIFAEDDETADGGNRVRFAAAKPARPARSTPLARPNAMRLVEKDSSQAVETGKAVLHLAFERMGKAEAAAVQLDEVVNFILGRMPAVEAARKAGEKYRIAVLGRNKNSLMRVAGALGERNRGAKAAGESEVLFRAIELVTLGKRPEVLDALALVRALLNPVDRTAWLGVLRAPWCGLSLAELHLLTSADDKEIAATAVPVLLGSGSDSGPECRLAQLRAEGRIGSRAYEAAARVGRTLRLAVESRADAGVWALGSWVESVWKSLGGADTVNAEQAENLRLLWACLDRLPEGDLDLIGPGLDAALRKLYAAPDPGASSDFGVQLMTIHKAKGLEFEVVLVVEMEAKGRTNEPSMISWLERGVAPAENADCDASAVTEFLIGPIQAKGEEIGSAKAWVDRIRREREREELRRVLYVAATRAREELHLFVRPRVKENALARSGDVDRYTLQNRTGLLATAWPALSEEVEARFAAWCAEQAAADTTGETEETHENMAEFVESLAAEVGSGLDAPAEFDIRALTANLVQRLPEGYHAPEMTLPGARGAAGGRRAASGDSGWGDSSSADSGPGDEAGLAALRDSIADSRSRWLGTAIHSLLELLSQLRLTLEPAAAARELGQELPSVVAALRSHGLAKAEARELADEAMAVTQRAAVDPVCSWILAPHAIAETETRWTGVTRSESGARQRNLRPDRVFFARREGEDRASWWVIDYKTSDLGGMRRTPGDGGKSSTQTEAFLAVQRGMYQSQLAAYAEVLRTLRGADSESEAKLPVRAGLYYPRLGLLDAWDA